MCYAICYAKRFWSILCWLRLCNCYFLKHLYKLKLLVVMASLFHSTILLSFGWMRFLEMVEILAESSESFLPFQTELQLKKRLSVHLSVSTLSQNAKRYLKDIYTYIKWTAHPMNLSVYLNHGLVDYCSQGAEAVVRHTASLQLRQFKRLTFPFYLRGFNIDSPPEVTFPSAILE